VAQDKQSQDLKKKKEFGQEWLWISIEKLQKGR